MLEENHNTRETWKSWKSLFPAKSGILIQMTFSVLMVAIRLQSAIIVFPHFFSLKAWIKDNFLFLDLLLALCGTTKRGGGGVERFGHVQIL